MVWYQNWKWEGIRFQVEDYDVYAYYANNYKDAVVKFDKLLEDPEFVMYLEVNYTFAVFRLTATHDRHPILLFLSISDQTC